jgi:hypothetical protein
MLTLPIKYILRFAIVTGATCSALQANAKDIPFMTPGDLRGTCIAAGGHYIHPSAKGVYGCALSDGNYISCGGVGGFKGTCSNSATRVRDHRRPPKQTGPVLGGATGDNPTANPAPQVEPVPGTAGGANGGEQPAAVRRDHRANRGGGGVVVRDHRGRTR